MRFPVTVEPPFSAIATCEYSWGVWSVCNMGCGNGVQTRQQRVIASPSGAVCEPEVEERGCIVKPCTAVAPSQDRSEDRAGGVNSRPVSPPTMAVPVACEGMS